MMDWKNLLSAHQLGMKAPGAPVAGRSPFARDLDRIIFSSAFRKLQDKTQVHPLSEHGHVRTRLTHSIEAGSVGRSLGHRVGAFIAPKLDEQGITADDFGYVVQAACMAHDIGNPPFGHAGEDAIGAWFSQNDWVFDPSMTEAEKEDLVNFEGNAQGFRILTSLERVGDAGGLQLTHAMLGTFTKYPGASNRVALKGDLIAGSKKHGFFQAEAGDFEAVAKGLGLIKREGRGPLWCRHPLAFLTEAADDICYSVADLDDGVAMGYVSFEEVEAHLAPLAWAADKHDTDLREESWYAQKDEAGKLGFMRGKAVGNLIDEVVKVFKKNEEALLTGAFEGDLIAKSKFADQVKACKSIANRKIFHTSRKLEIEVAGFEVLGGLLDLFCKAVIDEKIHPKQAHRLRELDGAPKPGKTRYESLLNVTDFVSGLTDHHAVSLFRKLKGISL